MSMWRFLKDIFVHKIWQCKASASDVIFKFSLFLLMSEKNQYSNFLELPQIFQCLHYRNECY